MPFMLNPPPCYLTDETWHLLAGSSSGELSGSGEAQVEAPWWGHRLEMALVNTVAFQGVWQKQFQFTNTQNVPFILSDGSAIKVPMMYQATEVSFGKRCHYKKVRRLSKLSFSYASSRDPGYLSTICNAQSSYLYLAGSSRANTYKSEGSFLSF